MFDIQVTRHQNGVNNERETSILSDIPLPNRLKLHEFLNDFDNYDTGDWTVTKVGTGTLALAAADGGVLALTNTTGASDQIVQQPPASSFQLVTGKRCWGFYRAKISATAAQLFLGLANTTTTPFAGVTDGIWLSSVGTTLSVNIRANSGTTQTLVATPTLVAGQPFTFGWYYDGALYGVTGGRVVFQLSGAGVSAAWQGEILCGSTFPFTTLLAPQMGILNTTGIASVLSLDTVYVGNERASPGATPVF